MRSLTIYIVIVSSLMLFSVNAHSYDDKEVHPNINESAIGPSENLAKALKMLGFVNIDSSLQGKRIVEYFREGGTKEDNATWLGEKRWLNHFHDPLMSWKKAGLKGVWFNYSSLAWASGAYWTDNDASWPVARASYYKALTKSTKADREQALADTFTQLGQVMHLVADSSVPAHVRNDNPMLVQVCNLNLNVSYGRLRPHEIQGSGYKPEPTRSYSSSPSCSVGDPEYNDFRLVRSPRIPFNKAVIS